MKKEFSEIYSKMLKDIAVELSDEFDKNFERKAFFGNSWEKRKREGKGSTLMVTGKLRRSIAHNLSGSSVRWTSSEDYAKIHNEGGSIIVTSKMKGYFWRKYYEASGRITYSRSGKSSKRNAKLSKDAEFYKAMALMKVGSAIRIPKRQFIGNSLEVSKAVEKVANHHLKGIEQLVKDKLKQKK